MVCDFHPKSLRIYIGVDRKEKRSLLKKIPVDLNQMDF
jgi:hypothetical protein